MRLQHPARSKLCTAPSIGAALFFPGDGRVTVGDGGVEVIALHRRNGMRSAQEMARSQHRLADRLITQRFFADFDPTQGAVDELVHLVIQDEGFEAGPQQ